jgi:hypothetical protein
MSGFQSPLDRKVGEAIAALPPTVVAYSNNTFGSDQVIVREERSA